MRRFFEMHFFRRMRARIFKMNISNSNDNSSSLCSLLLFKLMLSFKNYF